jgi:SagB-type dehydrogenase family enzyme
MRRPAALCVLTALAAVPALPPAHPLLAQQAAVVRLPEPRRDGRMSLEAALWARHSTRAFTRDSLPLADLAQLLWAAQGANRPDGHRTAPSAGATYPLEVLVLPARVSGLPAGTYRYRSGAHTLEPVQAGDRLPEFLQSAARAPWIADAAALLVITGVGERTARRYGERAERYVALEAGHAAQNVALQAAALGLGTTYVGSFVDSAVTRLLALPPGERPYAVLPVGRPR